ncbi:tetratricopeptide repeat protein, partial [Streptomyces sp. NPDC013489]|uniref:tetratricopeptide repeat protein n=1 Tax=Streptomyces sp. NPDC013489 TaxID=3155606 RepID=UPI0033DA2D71
RHQEALELEERVLADSERLLGPDHPHTLNTRKNVGIARGAVEALQHTSTATTTAVPATEPLSEEHE